MAKRGFEETVLPHLDAAFNYARWLTKNDAEAEDVVQDACVRAMRYFTTLRDGDGRAWLFAIVRNAWYSRLSRSAVLMESTQLNDARDEPPDEALGPEGLLLQQHAGKTKVVTKLFHIRSNHTEVFGNDGKLTQRISDRSKQFAARCLYPTAPLRRFVAARDFPACTKKFVCSSTQMVLSRRG